MSYRVGTPNYNLPQTEGTDKRDWSDTNQAFLAIDTAIKNAADTSASASSAAATAQQTADSANTAATNAQTSAGAAATLATSASELATTAKSRADAAYTLANTAKSTADSAETKSDANTSAIAQINNDLGWKYNMLSTAHGIPTGASTYSLPSVVSGSREIELCVQLGTIEWSRRFVAISSTFSEGYDIMQTADYYTQISFSLNNNVVSIGATYGAGYGSGTAVIRGVRYR